MKIILTKDIQLGKKGDIVSVSQPRGIYPRKDGCCKRAHPDEWPLKTNQKKKRMENQNQELLTKVKQNLSLDFTEQDGYLLTLIEAMKNVASERTGMDFNIEIMPSAVANSIVENVARKFDDNSASIDYSIFSKL